MYDLQIQIPSKGDTSHSCRSSSIQCLQQGTVKNPSTSFAFTSILTNAHMYNVFLTNDQESYQHILREAPQNSTIRSHSIATLIRVSSNKRTRTTSRERSPHKSTQDEPKCISQQRVNPKPRYKPIRYFKEGVISPRSRLNTQGLLQEINSQP